MATVNATNVGKYVGTGYSPIDSSLVYGKQRVWLDEFTAAAHPANTSICFAVMEKGFTLVDIVIMNAALGASVSMKVGDKGDDDRYINESASSSARTTSLLEDGKIAQVNKKFDEETILMLKFNQVTSGLIKFQVIYTVE